MALLGKRKPDNPVLVLEHELNALMARRTEFEQKLAAAVEAATNARRQSLLDADSSDEDASRRRDSAVHSARDQVEALADALREIGARIAAAEQRLASAREESERRELAALVRQEADALDRVRGEFSEVASRLVTAMQATCARTPNTAPELLPFRVDRERDADRPQ
jgi:chromosome segregation ATPase